MNTQDINLELLSELEIPEYHDYFVASQLNKGFSFQMRALRNNQNLTQKSLAELANTKQSVISRIESNGVSSLSVKSLLKLASAFNVGLVLRFVSLEHLLDWKIPISLEELAPQKSAGILKTVREKRGESSFKKTQNKAKPYKFELIQGNNEPKLQQSLYRPQSVGSAKKLELEVTQSKKELDSTECNFQEIKEEHTNRSMPNLAASTAKMAS